MLVLSAAEMAETDRRSAEAGVPLAELMENAGAAVAAFVTGQYPEAQRVMVLCGKGNNGGDGFVAARLLAAEGVGVRVLLAGTQSAVKGEAAAALAELRAATDDGIVEELGEELTAEELAGLLEEADLLVDAVLGTGFEGELRGVVPTLREAVAQVEVAVVAVDLPSGWPADATTEKQDEAFRADAVVTFTAPKPAHVFGHLTAAVFGPVVVAEIGSPAETVIGAGGLSWTGTAKAMTERPRPINSNKGKFGHVLVVGGSYGTAGAPSMASLACLHAGAGLVTAAVPHGLVPLLAQAAPELMVRGLAEGEEGSALAQANLDELQTLLKGIKVVALGPGLSTRGEASEFARGLYREAKDEVGKPLPMVIDADGLNAFDAKYVDELQGRGRTLVLTPHPGEMARLLGTTVAAVEADRLRVAREFATQHSLTLVLKGWRTLVAHPDGRVAVNTTGNPGLAKGGSGDTLTGIVAAMLAQYPQDVAAAVEAAVYLHGLAADLAVQRIDEKALLATDVIGSLSAAFRYRVRDAQGLTWLCGVRA